MGYFKWLYEFKGHIYLNENPFVPNQIKFSCNFVLLRLVGKIFRFLKTQNPKIGGKLELIGKKGSFGYM